MTKKTEKLATRQQVAELLGVRPQSVDGMVQRGRLFRNEGGLFDLAHPDNAAFLKEKGVKVGSVKIPGAKPAGRPLPGKQAPGTITTAAAGPRLTASEQRERNLKLKNEKLALEIEYRKGRLYPIEFIDGVIFRYLEKLHTNIERVASVCLDEIGGRILEAGRVTPGIETDHLNNFLKCIHDTKTVFAAAVENFDPRNYSIDGAKK
ncbi:MAG TPA: hypothetical protein PKY31_11200 [Spirochaetota bacterium]|nr:hypothetical protein [Spirochaetota bacterium]